MVSAWPVLLFVGALTGGAVGWLATKKARTAMDTAQGEIGKAHAQTVEVYRQTLTAKDELAATLKLSNKEQYDLLSAEKQAWKETAHRREQDRKESDEKHEKILAEYRELHHAIRNELQAVTLELGNAKAEVAEMKGRTDFTPIMEFHQAWRKEDRAMNQQILSTMQALAPVLGEVVAILKKQPVPVQDVHVVNTPEDRVPTSVG